MAGVREFVIGFSGLENPSLPSGTFRYQMDWLDAYLFLGITAWHSDETVGRGFSRDYENGSGKVWERVAAFMLSGCGVRKTTPSGDFSGSILVVIADNQIEQILRRKSNDHVSRLSKANRRTQTASSSSP
jgi:hypothetical protein